MSSFTWLNEYKTGNDTIDQQHQYLFDLANRIVDPFNDAQKTHHNVLELYPFFREHFKDEEALMKKYNYPNYIEHVKDHAVIAQKLREISTGIVRGRISRDMLMEFMRSWITEHTIGNDLLFGDYLSQKNNNGMRCIPYKV